jgi:hypothetical protein
MHTAAYKVDVASDRRRRENVPRQILFYVMYMEDRRMEFKYELENGCLTIRVPKELDHHCATQLRAEADLLIDSYRVNKLVFDFAGTEFMDNSSSVGFIWAQNAATATLANPSFTDNASNSSFILFLLPIFTASIFIPTSSPLLSSEPVYADLIPRKFSGSAHSYSLPPLFRRCNSCSGTFRLPRQSLSCP